MRKAIEVIGMIGTDDFVGLGFPYGANVAVGRVE